MTKFGIFLFSVLLLVAGGFLGYKYFEFDYNDKCLDLGGGKNPGGYPICVVEKTIEKEKVVYKEIEKKDDKTYFCDEKGNKFVSEDEARKYGLKDGEFGATYCSGLDSDDIEE